MRGKFNQKGNSTVIQYLLNLDTVEYGWQNSIR